MTQSSSSELFHTLFTWHTLADGGARLGRHPSAPATLPDPMTGRALRIAAVEVGGRTICPACESHGEGGFVSFVADLRLVYACPQCRQLVWLAGA
jgi:hypothetical protein